MDRVNSVNEIWTLRSRTFEFDGSFDGMDSTQ